MRPVVIDTSVVLPALLSPKGYRRRFLVVLAFGALAARRDLVRLEADALQAEALASGGALGGLPLQTLVERAEADHANLRERLPYGCPDDWRLVASRPVLDEYERKLRQAGRRLDPDLTDAEIETARRVIASLCTDVTEDFDPDQIPGYTIDPGDDAFVHTALLADATWLIADDRHIAPDRSRVTEYRQPGSERTVSALTFSHFLEHLTDVDLDDVEPELLYAALRLIPPR